MATRSGKTYQEPKRSRRRHINEDSNTTPNGKLTDNNLDMSNISNRDLRSRRSSTKNATFDKSDISVTKTSIDNATESNWIISDLTNKVIRRQSNINKSLNESISSGTSENIEQIPDSKLNSSQISIKQLRKRTSQNGDSTFNKSDQTGNVTFEKDTEKVTAVQKDIEITTANRKSHDKDKIVEMSRGDTNQDTENDLNSLNVGKTLRQKKKKGKGSKRKKQKGKVKEHVEEASNNVNILNTTFEKNDDAKDSPRRSEDNVQQNIELNSTKALNRVLRNRKSSINDTTFEKEDKPMDTTNEKDDKPMDTTYEKDERLDQTFDKDSDTNIVSKVSLKKDKSNMSLTLNKSYEKDAFVKITSTNSDTLKEIRRRSSIRDISIDKNKMVINGMSKSVYEKEEDILSSPPTKRMSLRRQTTEIIHLPNHKLDVTFDKSSELERDTTRRSYRLSAVPPDDNLNVTFDKEEIKDNLHNSKSSLISSDNSSVSRVSITSDESAENIVNTTPLLIESSMDESQVKQSPKRSREEPQQPLTPLKREGTFTKEAPEVQLLQTPGKGALAEVPAAGCTPYHVSKSSQKKPMLNVTRSIEKRLSIDPSHRMTRVMFCSPIDHPTSFTQEKRKIIKSNLKGSNKSFVFDENLSMTRAARKRSYTQNDADDARTKRSRLAEDLQESVDRLSRPRTPSATTKLGETTPKKSNTPYKSKSETKPARTRLPNFAILHQKQFDKMESLGECQERKAKRAQQMLSPSVASKVLKKISPKSKADCKRTLIKETVKSKDKKEIPSKKPLTLESLKPGFTRFGFKLNLDINPFSIPPKTDQPKEKLNGIVLKPSLTGATVIKQASDRREAAKQTVMREKSFLEKRKVNRSENRTIIKGVRTNRRFELQMKLRNID